MMKGICCICEHGSVAYCVGGNVKMTVGGCGGVVTRTQVGHTARTMMLAVESAVAMLCWLKFAAADVAVAVAIVVAVASSLSIIDGYQ